MHVSVAICTSMRIDIKNLVTRLLKTECREIIIIGNEGKSFPNEEWIHNPRIVVLYGPPDLASKRMIAIEKFTGDVIAFVDDDALISDKWYESINSAFSNSDVGGVTGPSILPDKASLWLRTAQLVLGSSPQSFRRYNLTHKGFVDWWCMIGANMAFRREALIGESVFSSAFPREGEDMIAAFNVSRKWKIFYDPDAYVFHPPHGFLKQCKQIFIWGTAFVRLSRAGVQYPEIDRAYILYIPLLVLFKFIYLMGITKEWLFGRRNPIAKAGK